MLHHAAFVRGVGLRVLAARFDRIGSEDARGSREANRYRGRRPDPQMLMFSKCSCIHVEGNC